MLKCIIERNLIEEKHEKSLFCLDDNHIYFLNISLVEIIFSLRPRIFEFKHLIFEKCQKW